MSSTQRRPIDAVTFHQIRHLKNRRDTLVQGIVQNYRKGDFSTVEIIRQECNRVNQKLIELGAC